MCRRKGLEWDPNPISFSGHEVETIKSSGSLCIYPRDQDIRIASCKPGNPDVWKIDRIIHILKPAKPATKITNSLS